MIIRALWRFVSSPFFCLKNSTFCILTFIRPFGVWYIMWFYALEQQTGEKRDGREVNDLKPLQPFGHLAAATVAKMITFTHKNLCFVVKAKWPFRADSCKWNQPLFFSRSKNLIGQQYYKTSLFSRFHVCINSLDIIKIFQFIDHFLNAFTLFRSYVF